MKYKVLLIGICLSFCYNVKIQQLFEVLNQELDTQLKQGYNFQTTPTTAVSSAVNTQPMHNAENSLFENLRNSLPEQAPITQAPVVKPTSSPQTYSTTNSNFLPQQNTIREEPINASFDSKEHLNEIEKKIQMTTQDNHEIDEIKAKLIKLKTINEKLNAVLKHKDDYENQKEAFSNEIEALVKEGYNKIDNKFNNKDLIANSNLIKVQNNLSEKIENYKALDNKLKETRDNIKSFTNENQNQISQIKAADIGLLKVNDFAKINKIISNEFDFGSLKGGETINISPDSDLVFGDKRIPFKTLLEFHKSVKAIQEQCGEDLTKCHYLDSETIGQEVINQTTLLAEIKHLGQLISKLTKENN
jgi:hypothetical protein